MSSRLLFPIVVVVALAALAASCTQDKRTTVVQPSSESTGVSASGRGEVQAPPDTGFFNVGVEVHAKTVADARDQAGKAADAVIKSLKSNRVDEKDIKTTQLAINPEYDYKNGGGQPKIVGYVVTNTVEVKVRKLDDFSKIVDDAAVAGGDNTRLQGIRFDIEDNTKLLEQARKAAMDDAKKKAEELAKLGGVKLGSPLSIAETQSTTPPPELAVRDLIAPSNAGAATPIQAGTGSVIVTVQVRWGIEG